MVIHLELGRVHDFSLFKQYFAGKAFSEQKIWVDRRFSKHRKIH